MATDVQDNTAAVAELTARIQAHPLCLTFTNDCGRYVVMYPPGDFGVDGVQASWAACGKARALARVLVAMERHWLGSYPGVDRVALVAKINAIEREVTAGWGNPMNGSCAA